jgi:hypothetical protein
MVRPMTVSGTGFALSGPAPRNAMDQSGEG